MAIQQSTLRAKSTSFEQRFKQRASTYNRTMFLCHSHKDRDIAMGLVALLRQSGVTLYVDWLDDSMPDRPSAETARRIKTKIRESDLFIFLATENSMVSRWCPWEIGCGDAFKGEKKVLVTQTQDYYGKTYGSEYLDLYPRIELGSLGRLRGVLPGRSYGDPIADFIRSL